ncbi:hypothetical protein EK21DRAFT_85846 [Setomelanomma holmii]|uniref:Uncharacterized protein n=1 Tax=Setomelanomma holmii TaxID=210430 RepID=A0A9P4HHC5_9PLEO|nr:hypothetical protein EK21DRAFT_85846 [Setomelanomma holmii]
MFPGALSLQHATSADIMAKALFNVFLELMNADGRILPFVISKSGIASIVFLGWIAPAAYVIWRTRHELQSDTKRRGWFYGFSIVIVDPAFFAAAGHAADVMLNWTPDTDIWKYMVPLLVVHGFLAAEVAIFALWLGLIPPYDGEVWPLATLPFAFGILLLVIGFFSFALIYSGFVKYQVHLGDWRHEWRREDGCVDWARVQWLPYCQRPDYIPVAADAGPAFPPGTPQVRVPKDPTAERIDSAQRTTSGVRKKIFRDDPKAEDYELQDFESSAAGPSGTYRAPARSSVGLSTQQPRPPPTFNASGSTPESTSQPPSTNLGPSSSMTSPLNSNIRLAPTDTSRNTSGLLDPSIQTSTPAVMRGTSSNTVSKSRPINLPPSTEVDETESLFEDISLLDDDESRPLRGTWKDM